VKISEVNIDNLKNYSHIYHAEDDGLLSAILVASKSFIRNYTGLTPEQMDLQEDLTICLYVLASDMYDNRMYVVEASHVNAVIKSILDSHSINLLR
jgi:N12 class adenine-specific DNA methylase